MSPIDRSLHESASTVKRKRGDSFRLPAPLMRAKLLEKFPVFDEV
jgi:hypothetical protein